MPIAMIVTITVVAQYGSGFLARFVGMSVTKTVTLGLAVLFLVIALGLNFTGTKTFGRVAKIGLAAALIGVIAVGLYLLIFQRQQEFSVFFTSMGVAGNGSYGAAFLGAALAGRFLFYGFEAGEDVTKTPIRFRRSCKRRSGIFGARIFLLVALTAFLSCVLSLQQP